MRRAARARDRVALVTAAAVTAALTACGGSGTSDDGGASGGGARKVAVDVENFAYAPTTIEVPPGATVVWTNRDAFAHTVTAGSPDDPRPTRFEGDLGDVDDNAAARGTTFARAFDDAGSYAYFCELHPRMRGIIEVRS